MTVAWRGVISVTGGFLVHLTLGVLCSDGNIGPYLISYIHDRIDSTIHTSYTAMIGPLHGACYGILTIPSSYLAARIGYRLTVAMASLIFSGAVALTFFTIKSGFWLVILTFALVNGLGASMQYCNTIACGMKWFPQNHGTVGGIVVAGFGLGALMFNPLQSFLANPDNAAPNTDGYFVDPAMLDRIPSALLYLAATYFLVQIIGSVMLFQPPEMKRVIKENRSGSQNSGDHHMSSSMAPVAAAGDNLSPLQMLRTKEFYFLWYLMFSNTCAMEFVNAMYKAYGETFIFDDHYLAFVGSIMSIANALGRFVWGYLLDRSSFTPCVQIVTTALAALMFTMPAIKAYGDKALYTVWNVAVFFFVSGTFSLTPAISVTVFGETHMAANYGILFTSTIASGLCIGFLSYFLDRIGYIAMFYTLACVNVVGIFVTFAFKHVREKKTNDAVVHTCTDKNVSNGIQVFDIENKNDSISEKFSSKDDAIKI